MKEFSRVRLTLAALVLMAGCQAPATHDRQGSAETDQLSDANVFALLMAANASDIEGGKLASQRAESCIVKEFGERMVNDHSVMQEQGTTVGKRLTINPVLPVPAQRIVRAHGQAMEGLHTASGRDFDLGYLAHEIDMHQHLIQLIEQRGRSSTQPEIRQVLDQARWKLQEHLDAARAAREQLVGW